MSASIPGSMQGEAAPRRTIRETALSDLPGLRARHADVFRGQPGTRFIAILSIAAAFALLIYGMIQTGFGFERIWNGLGNLGNFVVFMVPPDPTSYERGMMMLNALFETIAIAFLGTFVAAAIALPLGFLAARNTTIHASVQFLTRRTSDIVRSIDQLIWALIFTSVVGLGPFAGVLAIMMGDIGSYIKLFSEAIENADKKPVEGIVSTGGTSRAAVRFGVLPQVLPILASQVLYYFESNTRSSTIIGVVGAGGIGLLLSDAIRTLEWQQVSFMIILILIAVAVIDFVSGKLRAALIGKQNQLV
jgi:phosphonate transport system permease protein